jgi:glycerol uptake facilitator-like aquaporin
MAISYGIRGYNESLDMHPRGTTNNVLLVTLAEFGFSLIFLTIYMHAKNDWVSPSMDFGLRAYTMMGVQYLCAAMSLKVTGGALNPSIGFSAVIFRLIVNREQTNNAIFLIAYLIGPLLAGAVAGLYIRYFAVHVTPPNEAAHGSPFMRRATLKKVTTLEASASLISK